MNPELETSQEYVTKSSYKDLFLEIEKTAETNGIDPQIAYELYENMY
jgi:hypothetical protein